MAFFMGSYCHTVNIPAISCNMIVGRTKTLEWRCLDAISALNHDKMCIWRNTNTTDLDRVKATRQFAKANPKGKDWHLQLLQPCNVSKRFWKSLVLRDLWQLKLKGVQKCSQAVLRELCWEVRHQNEDPRSFGEALAGFAWDDQKFPEGQSLKAGFNIFYLPLEMWQLLSRTDFGLQATPLTPRSLPDFLLNMARNIQKLPHGCTSQTSKASEHITSAFPVPTTRKIWQK